VRSIIAFSSGYDSLYIAWKYLTETNNDVTLFFMDMSLLQEQQEVESYINIFQKYTSIRSHKWMKENLRDHKFETRVIRKMDHKCDHTKQFIRITTKMINEGLYDEVVHGSYGNAYRNVEQAANVTRTDVIKKEFDSLATRGSLRLPLAEWEWNKNTANLMVELPKEMRHLVISCNFATTDDNGDFIECGSCHKCFRNKTLGDQLKNGSSPEEAWKNYMNTEKAKAVNGSFFESKDRWGYFDEVK